LAPHSSVWVLACHVKSLAEAQLAKRRAHLCGSGMRCQVAGIGKALATGPRSHKEQKDSRGHACVVKRPAWAKPLPRTRASRPCGSGHASSNRWPRHNIATRRAHKGSLALSESSMGHQGVRIPCHRSLTQRASRPCGSGHASSSGWPGQSPCHRTRTHVGFLTRVGPGTWRSSGRTGRTRGVWWCSETMQKTFFGGRHSLLNYMSHRETT
jgi:hypothetical protein